MFDPLNVPLPCVLFPYLFGKILPIHGLWVGAQATEDCTALTSLPFSHQALHLCSGSHLLALSSGPSSLHPWFLPFLHLPAPYRAFPSVFNHDLSSQGFPGGSDGKESACSFGDLGWIPGSGRSPGGGNGNPLQYSCLGNPLNRGAWRAIVQGVSKSRTATEQPTLGPLFQNCKKTTEQTFLESTSPPLVSSPSQSRFLEESFILIDSVSLTHNATRSNLAATHIVPQNWLLVRCLPRLWCRSPVLHLSAALTRLATPHSLKCCVSELL